MLEYVSLCLSLLLLTYCLRSIIFLHESYSVSVISPRKNQRGNSIFNKSIPKTATPDLLNNIECRLNHHCKDIKFESFPTTLNSTAGNVYRSGEHHTPVVSFLVATKNEEALISDLLGSLSKLTYDKERFEIIIVDNSQDSTFKILQDLQKKIKNLKIVRQSTAGWKGSALNTALQHMRNDSSWVIVVDADTILPSDIIDQFLVTLSTSKVKCDAIQGYCVPCNNDLSRLAFSNWVSKGIEFRLAQRNLIEFVAKRELDIPVQITGSLFMIKSSLIKEIGFSNDLCEDWDLTLKLYTHRSGKKTRESAKDRANSVPKTIIVFDENLVAKSQAPISLSTYFMQRLRVSEGHTRGFIKMVIHLWKSDQAVKNKIEISFTGLRYLKNLIIPLVLLLDTYTVFMNGITYSLPIILLVLIQAFCLASMLGVNITTIPIICRNKHYGLSFLLSKLLLDLCVMPAIITGSIVGFLRRKGTFYRTKRTRLYSARETSEVQPPIT